MLASATLKSRSPGPRGSSNRSSGGHCAASGSAQSGQHQPAEQLFWAGRTLRKLPRWCVDRRGQHSKIPQFLCSGAAAAAALFPRHFSRISILTIRSLAELEQHIGQELGVSAFHQITQAQIDAFAAATLDFQWIHVDAERTAAESPFGSTIAHGYLTLSLLPYLWAQIVRMENLKMQVNYEIESLRFNQAVTVNSEVRLRARLLEVKNLRGIAKSRIEVTLDIKDQKKPAYTGVVTFLYHFTE